MRFAQSARGARGVALALGIALLLLVACTGCATAPVAQRSTPTATTPPTATPFPTITPPPSATPLPVASPVAHPAGWSTGTDPHWSGYVFPSAATITGVRALWREPLVTGKASAEEFTWVGIGGWGSSNGLIQVGTFAYFPPSGGLHQGIWYESIPPNIAKFPLIDVSPGDQIFASIERTQANPQTWHMLLLDVTTGAEFDQTIAYTSSESSAEYVVEDPNETQSSGPPYYPLPTFSPVTFTNMQLSLDGSWVSADAVYGRNLSMLQNGHELTHCGPLRASSFTLTRDATTP
ncbi:MAG TPA: G1 family glutamic endopeptidase [Ktedonobacterales bacterium]